MEQKYVRISFDIELAKEITNGTKEGRIITRNGESVRILSFDRKDEYRPIIVLIENGDMENVYALGIDGKEVSGDTIGTNDLMLEIPEYMTFKDGDVIAYDSGCTIGISTGEYILNGHKDMCVRTHVLHSSTGIYINRLMIVKSTRYATREEVCRLKEKLRLEDNKKLNYFVRKFLTSKEEPKYNFKPFDKVLVRNSDDMQWGARFFDRMFEGDYACTDSLCYKQCIPYKGNEHLRGTTLLPEQGLKSDLQK